MRRFKSLLLVLPMALMLSTCAAPAYAFSDEDAETSVETPAPSETPAQPLTPEGNMALVDDIEGEAAEDKQFIVVQSRGGHYFYIIIDNASEGENTVHFLNQVDEADLLSIIEEEEQAPAVCSCAEKCVPGAVNTACEICAVNMGECAGKEPEPVAPEEPAEPDTPPELEKKGGGTGPLLIVLVLAVAGVGAVVYLKFFKKKAPDTRGTANLDDYDYGADDEDEDEPEDEDE